MNFKYNGDKKDLVIFGYDFSSGFAEVDNEHLQNKLKNIPEFEEINDIDGEVVKLTANDLKALLDKQGIAYKVNDSKKVLQSLLDEADDENTTD